MKALTLYQPWATLVAIGAKKIETRSWNTNYRGELAIHAGLSRYYINPKYSLEVMYTDPFYGKSKIVPENIQTNNYIFPLGAIVAICELVRVEHIKEGYWKYITWEERAFGNYTPGRYAWILEDVRALAEPIPAKGKQRLWEWI